MTRRLIHGIAAMVVLAAAVADTNISPAGAQVSGGCSASINTIDFGAARSARTAISVGETETVTVAGNAPGPITGYKVFMAFGPVRFPVAEGTVTDNTTSYATDVNVKDYARYGVGIYRVEGETTGTSCTGWGYVKVTGRFPLATLAGALGGLFTLGGLLGLIFSFPGRPKGAT